MAKKIEVIDNHIKEIGAPWISEMIDEVFDGAPDLLTDNAIVFGGAVRDILAGLPLQGDLDIAVSDSEYNSLIQSFTNSSKWVNHDPDSPKRSRILKPYIPKKNNGNNHSIGDDSTWAVQKYVITPKKNYKDVPIERISTFYSNTGRKVQIMTSIINIYNEISGEIKPLESAIYPARLVDIRCCGVIMTKDGRIYEVIDGAHQDCIDKVLHVGKITASLDVNRLRKRIEKLIGRGWTSDINLKDVGKAANKLKAIDAAIERARVKKMQISTCSKQAVNIEELLDMIQVTQLSETSVLLIPQRITICVDSNKVYEIVKNIIRRTKYILLSNKSQRCENGYLAYLLPKITNASEVVSLRHSIVDGIRTYLKIHNPNNFVINKTSHTKEYTHKKLKAYTHRTAPKKYDDGPDNGYVSSNNNWSSWTTISETPPSVEEFIDYFGEGPHNDNINIVVTPRAIGENTDEIALNLPGST